MAEQVGPTHKMWRQATLEQVEWLAQYEQRAAMREAKPVTVSSQDARSICVSLFSHRSKRSSSCKGARQ